MGSHRAVVLVSGGLDSSTTLAIAKSQGYRCYALTCIYGQRHQHEIEAAQRVTEALEVEEHRIIRLDLGGLAGSALTDESVAVPKGRDLRDMEMGIPVTYVPARNTILLSLALAWAESCEIFDIFMGVNAVDYSGYPDCRPEFIQAFEKMANLATAAGVDGRGVYRIQTPIIRLTKAEIIQQGMVLGVDYSLTHTCYDPNTQGISCGQCDACLLRLQGFSQNGMKDPLPYQETPE